jgi:hypothetical protein
MAQLNGKTLASTAGTTSLSLIRKDDPETLATMVFPTFI